MAKKKHTAARIRIVGYGCSYTAGDELLDHHMNPEADKFKRLKGMAQWRHQHPNRRPLLEPQILRRQLALSWVAKLATKLDLPYENRSERGTSLAEHVYTIERDIAVGRISPTDLVMVGVTTPWRSCFFPEDSLECRSYLFSMPEHWPRPNWHAETLLEVYTDRHLYLDHLLLQLRLAQIPRVYLVNMEGNPCESYDPVVEARKKQLAETNRILGTESLFSLIEDYDKELHGGGHPKVEVHRRLAKHLEPFVRGIISEL